MSKKITQFNITEEDKNNIIYYLSESKYNPEPELLVNITLEYEFDINNKNKYLINETDLQLLLNSIYAMSNELKELKGKKRK